MPRSSATFSRGNSAPAQVTSGCSRKVGARQLNLTIARLRDVAGPSAPENRLCDHRTPIDRDRLAGKRAAALFDDFETASTFLGFCAIVGGTSKCDKGCSMRESTP